MPAAPIPYDEAERLRTLQELQLLDTPIEERFDRITRILKQSLSVPMTAFSLIDEERQWLKSAQGPLPGEMPREDAFCGHAILGEGVLYVPDASMDTRFSDNPLVTGEVGIRFYAGCPISAANGQRIGTLCAIDTKARHMTAEEEQTLRDLASLVETELRATRLSLIQGDLISELGMANRLALVDPLTLVWNRRGIEELLKDRWSEAARHGHHVMLAIADIDHFKSINDTHGHDTGDAVLRGVAQRLMGAVREEDAVGRIGGEEFLLLLSGHNPEMLIHTVERIREHLVAQPILIGDKALIVTASFGAASCIASDIGHEALIKRADEALYTAKRSGRNRVEAQAS